MNIQRFTTGLCVALLTVALAAPSLAGPQRRRGGNGDGAPKAERLRLRDGSCLSDETAPNRARTRVRPDSATPARQRLRDGSGRQSPAPTPAPEPPTD
jgi:hypothetical protein